MASTTSADLLKWLVGGIVALALLYVVYLVYLSGQHGLAATVLACAALGFFVYTNSKAYTYRYLFPGLAGILVFIVFPLAYTISIGFTNYSSKNLLAFERAKQYFLEESYPLEGSTYEFTLHAESNDEFRLVFQPRPQEGEAEAPADGAEAKPAPPRPVFVSDSLALLKPAPPEIVAKPLAQSSFTPKEPLPLTEVIKHRNVLAQLKVKFPDGSVATMAGLREFAPNAFLYKENPDGSLTNVKSGETLKPNMQTGFFETAKGEPVKPGFKVGIGWGNYARIFTEPEFRDAFFRIFIWTVVFAGLTVFFTLCVGMTLAVLLNWEALKFRTIYRTLLFLPYAVPGFISILVFKGLFNQNFGEINAILDALFGTKPAWFADPFLAKCMILIVNTWLGYPYVMVLCTGLIKAIPSDLYEASAIAGAGPLTNLFSITVPLIIKPLTPLLISSFAFNFNNFVLIALLTNGRPDFLDTKIPAGTTDILVSYTYRIAFQDSGQNFGLAAAISTVIFILVATLSMANLKLTKVGAQA